MSRRHTVPQLDLIPVLGLTAILIPMLLLTAQVTPTAVVSTTLPAF